MLIYFQCAMKMMKFKNIGKLIRTCCCFPSDEDFAPSSKKSRTQLKESKKEKKEKPKKPKEVTPSQTLSKR